MIHVVELPLLGAPRAWFAFDAQDLLAKTALALGVEAWTVWDCTSVRELLGLAPDELPSPAHAPALCALGQAHGWDTPLYRADAVLGAGLLQTEPVTPLAACKAALGQRADTRVYPDDGAAMAAFERGHAEFGASGWRGRWALRQQLIALDVLADDT